MFFFFKCLRVLLNQETGGAVWEAYENHALGLCCRCVRLVSQLVHCISVRVGVHSLASSSRVELCVCVCVHVRIQAYILVLIYSTVVAQNFGTLALEHCKENVQSTFYSGTQSHVLVEKRKAFQNTAGTPVTAGDTADSVWATAATHL